MSWMQRRWTEFRFGDATYLRYLLNFGQFVIVAYTLGNFNVLFPSVFLFLLFFLLLYAPLAIGIGHYVHRARQMGTDAIIGMTANPLGVYTNIQYTQQIIDLCEHTGTPVLPEYRAVNAFWRRIYHQHHHNWRLPTG